MIRYRGWLERKTMMEVNCFFIMMNPSTADEQVDDPTIRRCKGFAARLALGRLAVVNLFTARATDPEDLIDKDDPVGAGADAAIQRIMDEWSPGDMIICAWGATHARWPAWFLGMRSEQIHKVFDWAEALRRPTFALGFTVDGSPRHPLYVRADAPLLPIARPVPCDLRRTI